MHATFRPRPLVLIALGAGVGVLSGLFGIGGGVVMVPILTYGMGLPQRVAAGTSVAAILPAGVMGAVGYAAQGEVNWWAGLLLAAGMIVGAQLGSYLLARVPVRALQWLFRGFLVLVIVSLWASVPQRSDAIEPSALSGALLALVGLLTGVFSGLLGVGGGVIVVPILLFFFGANDLEAKGASLLMLIPGSVSGTIANASRRLVDFRTALWAGIAAAVFSPLGTWAAGLIEPRWSNIAFSVLVAAILIHMLMQGRRRGPRGGS